MGEVLPDEMARIQRTAPPGLPIASFYGDV
jgi:hypothetical protein